MIALDSSAWIDYFTGGAHARQLSQALEETDRLLVPVSCLFEVFKVLSRYMEEGPAMVHVGAMMEGVVAPVDSAVALSAAKLAQKQGLAMADSLILATARAHGAELWTLDDDFKGLEGVRYFSKKAKKP